MTLPLLQTAEGMPLGVQLVGRRDNDARLLRTARWLVQALRGDRRGRGRRGTAARTGGPPRPGKRRPTG